MTHRSCFSIVAASLSLTLLHCSSQRHPAESPSAMNQGTTTTTMMPESSTSENGMTPASGTAAPSEQTSPTASAAPQQNPLNDGQIAAITEAANNAEIEQAKVAQDKCKDPRVKKFAAMMITDHTKAKQKQADLVSRLSLTPSESTESQQLATDTADALNNVRNAGRNDCDTMYMDAQVSGHQQLLDLMENVLIPRADNAELKKMLQDMKPTVAMHLQQARDLRQSLTSKSSGSSTNTKRGSDTTSSPGNSGSNGNSGSSGNMNQTPGNGSSY